MASKIHCRHWSNPFVGGQRRDTCAHGIDIRKLVGGPGIGWACRRPCVHGAFHRPDEAVTCDKREPYTAQEVAEYEARMRQATDRFLAGRSPCCNADLIAQGTARFCANCKEMVGRVCRDEDVEGEG
jgi:hypothetical protein